MASFCEDLVPTELYTEIFKFLPRTDRLCCSVVCRKWKEALDRQDLWKKFVLYVDKDFFENSTTLLTRDYFRHIKTLEIGWERPYVQNRWLPLKVQDLTRRLVQYLFMLSESDLQINCFRMFEWYDAYPFKRVVNYLARFLRFQKQLKKLIFHNTSLPKSECIKIFKACMSSKNSITYLEIHNYFYNINTAFDTIEFLGFLSQFSYLQELKLDYLIFSRPPVIEVVTEIGKNHLKLLEIYVDETDLHSSIVPNEKWINLRNCCPNLKVSVSIKNICHYEQIGFLFLMENIPLNSFSMVTSCKYNQKISRNFEETISKLIDNFHETLEFVRLELKNNREQLDDILLTLVINCPKLKRLFFDGNLNVNMNLFYEICKYKQSAKGLSVKIKPHRYKSVMNIIHMFS